MVTDTVALVAIPALSAEHYDSAQESCLLVGCWTHRVSKGS